MVQCYECGTVYPETMRCCPNCGSEAKIQLAPNSEFEEPKKPYVQPYRPYGMPMNNRMNGYAIAGFVLSCVALVLMCVFPPLSILGIVFSALGLSQIKKSFQRGKGLAVAGLTIGIMTTVFSVFCTPWYLLSRCGRKVLPTSERIKFCSSFFKSLWGLGATPRVVVRR